jgi:hypothetical protein
MKSNVHRQPLAHSVVINAPRIKVWNSLTDWPSQSSWMAMTSVESRSHGEPIGTEIFALTGLFARRNLWLKKYLGILDHMVVTQWNPPQSCEVEHVGKIIKGMGRFSLVETTANSTRFDWYEEILAPKLIMLILRPGIMLGVRFSLWRFTRSFRNE